MIPFDKCAKAKAVYMKRSVSIVKVGGVVLVNLIDLQRAVYGKGNALVRDRRAFFAVAEEVLPIFALVAEVTERDVFSAKQKKRNVAVLNCATDKLFTVKTYAAAEVAEGAVEVVEVFAFHIATVPMPDVAAVCRAKKNGG